MMRLGRFIRDDTGATSVVVASMFMLLLTILGVLVDTARLTIAQNKLQLALDAAAIAAARDAGTMDVATEVNKFFNANFPANYMGMGTPSVNVSQNGNTYTFNVSAPMPYSLLPGLGSGRGNSQTLSVTSVLSTGGGGSTSEIAVILDNSALMASNTSGGVSRLSVMKSVATSLIDAVKGNNPYLSLIHFNDAVRISPAKTHLLLNTSFASTLPHFSQQSAVNHGRFDGCMSSYAAEENDAYPTANDNNYLLDNEPGPKGFRQYGGPVDSAGYDMPSAATYGSLNIQDILSVTTSSSNYSASSRRVYANSNSSSTADTESWGGFNFTSGESRPITETGAADQYLYQSYRMVDKSMDDSYSYSHYRDTVRETVCSMGAGCIQMVQRNTYSTSQKAPAFTRKIDFRHNYIYALKAYLGYNPVRTGSGWTGPSAATTVAWTAYNETGATITSGTSAIAATGGSGSRKYAAEIILPVPYRPFSSVLITYPRPAAGNCSADYDSCKESGKYTPCQTCTSIGCTANSCPSVGYPYLDRRDFVQTGAKIGPVSAFQTCGSLVSSVFLSKAYNQLKTDIGNLVTGGPARVNIGLRWGWNALGEKWAGFFDPSLSQIPSNYKGGNKFAVLITQGSNFKNRAQAENQADGTYHDDNHLTRLCTAMKNKGIKLYVVGVGVTDAATLTRLTNCSSGTGYYVNATTAAGASTLISHLANSITTSPSGSLAFH